MNRITFLNPTTLAQFLAQLVREGVTFETITQHDDDGHFVVDVLFTGGY